MPRDDERLALENAFIEAHRERLASLGPGSYESTGSRGVLLIQRAGQADQSAAEIRYLTKDEMQAAGLIGEGGPPIQQAVTQALTQYDPLTQVVLLFLYVDDGTVYLADVEDLLSPF